MPNERTRHRATLFRLALGLTALLRSKIDAPRRVAVVISGGNVDLSLLSA